MIPGVFGSCDPRKRTTRAVWVNARWNDLQTAGVSGQRNEPGLLRPACVPGPVAGATAERGGAGVRGEVAGAPGALPEAAPAL